MESVGDGITVIDEPRRIECGAPDLRIERRSVPIGYIEAKNVGTSLQEAGRSEQLRRYRASLTNLILTDYLEFWWYVSNKRRETARLAELGDDGEIREIEGGTQAVSELLDRFFAAELPTITGPRELAERMAGLARLTRKLIEETFQHETGTDKDGSLHAQYQAFREVLIPDLTYE
ncbi:MAG: type ISP restriction/modification enzyme, partial [Candidatus Thorarchaeota archaeon]